MKSGLWLAFLFPALLLASLDVRGQRVEIRGAEPVTLPLVVDSNSPVIWRDGRLQIYTSSGTPVVSFADSLAGPFETVPVGLDRDDHLPMWIESVWQDDDGAVFGWYHHERLGVCPGSTLTTPMIGAVVSYDGGRNFHDLGIVIDSGEPVNCTAENGYFANGHGDFSVVLDRERGFFYFFMGAYAGAAGEQGVAAARMAFNDRFYPAGAVYKYYQGAWDEPGLGGKTTAVFPAATGWEDSATDSFWGPSVHWNTSAQAWVMMLNRACCSPGWPQEGIYISFSADLSDPTQWKTPLKLIEGGEWYPQVIGLGPGETDSEAGQTVRLFVRGFSDLELILSPEEEAVPEQPDPESTSP